MQTLQVRCSFNLAFSSSRLTASAFFSAVVGAAAEVGGEITEGNATGVFGVGGGTSAKSAVLI